MTASALVAEGFGRRYRRDRPWALRDVNLNLPAGSITALVGPNGAGKSTLVRACMAFEQPDEGRVLVFGADPQQSRARAIESVGYVPQSTSLYRRLRVRDHLVMARAARRTFDAAYAEGRLKEAGISVDRHVSGLSGGEQAQVALALAIGTRAPLLLLDEPLASLDPLARRDFLTVVIADVRSRNATAILSSHIITDIQHACDRLAVLGAGRLLLDARIEDALREFVAVPYDAVQGRPVVGIYSGEDGALRALIRSPSAGPPASLDDIVLGHLASAKQKVDEVA